MRKSLKYLRTLTQSSIVSCFQGTQLLELPFVLEKRERVWNKSPTVQGKMVNNILHKLDINLGTKWNTHIGTQRTGKSAQWTGFHNLSEVPSNWRRHWSWLEVGQYYSHLEEGLEGSFGKLQVFQCGLGSGRCHGADHLEFYNTAGPASVDIWKVCPACGYCWPGL